MSEIRDQLNPLIPTDTKYTGCLGRKSISAYQKNTSASIVLKILKLHFQAHKII